MQVPGGNREGKKMKSPNGDLCIGERVVIFPPRVEAQLST